jgi:hypothetical protein
VPLQLGNRQAVRLAITTFLVAHKSEVPHFGKVFGFPAKFTPEGEFYPDDAPGALRGCLFYLYFGDSQDERVALGGPTDGRKWVKYDLSIRCIFRSSQKKSEAAGEANEAMLDGLTGLIRSSRNADSPGTIFQWGEGDQRGGPDIHVKSYYPQQLNEKLASTQIISDVEVTVAQVIDS